MPKTQLIGPFFFKDDTINGENYLSMRQNFFLREIRRLYKLLLTIFQKNRASLYFAIDVQQYLNHQFPHRWIGRGSPTRLIPRSLDLPRLDSFL